MQRPTDVIPGRRVIEAATAVNNALGHDNLGSLSYSRGFLPRQEPAKRLPSGHAAWDEVAAAIPSLFRTYSVRKTLNDMPLLSADEADLPDTDLLRASSLFSILAHVYWYSEPEPPANGIPPQIQQPWEQITRRLDRPAPHLAFSDLNSHNWHFIDPHAEQPFIVENLKLAIPMIGNEDERRFQVTPIEMLALFAPLLDIMLQAQEAVVRDDPEALKQSLVAISDALNYQTYVSLMKVNPNPYSDHYINPVVWGKTAALYASPFQTENAPPGPSGTAIPSFTTLDVFFGRKRHQSTVGRETDRTRGWFPKHWRDWLTALEAISVPDYVQQKGDRTLKGIFDEARDAYAGENGMLSRHRLKAYGFLDLSFKAGRVKTLGGIGGSYSERVWDRLATELDDARLERYGAYSQTTHRVTIKRVDTIREHDQQPVRRVVFDIANTGLRYQPGDRCGILPENSDELVEKTLRALRATGDEMIQLNGPWRQHANLRDGYQDATELPLRALLTFGRIRPVDRSVAVSLHRLTKSGRLCQIVDAWAEDQWEFWDLLDMLAEGGYNPRRLWKAIPGDAEHICRVIPPERWRLYSISSVMEQDAEELHLTIGGLRYQTASTEVSPDADRYGTGSSFLARLCAVPSPTSRRISIKVIHPSRFSLPKDNSRPVILFAGGTGIAPMRGLIEARMHALDAGPTWLFLGTRERDDFYYQSELEPYVASGKLHIRVAFSRDNAAAHFIHDQGRFEFVPGKRQHLDALMLDDENGPLLWELIRSLDDGGQGAYLYVCGRTSFANSVIDALTYLLYHHADGGRDSMTEERRQAAGRRMLRRLVGEDRLMLEIFTTYTGAHFAPNKRQFDISDIALHNDDEHGYWIIVSGRVYDTTGFNHIHPGGMKIIQSYAGMDATLAYQKVEHHVNPEVDAMLGMVELGVVRVPRFGSEWGVALSDRGLRTVTLRDAYYAWVDLLFAVVEMENAVLNDFRIRHEPLTDIETAGHVLLTAAKVQQLSRTHERLVTGYLDGILGAPMHRLWALTIGLLGRTDLKTDWLADALNAVRSTEQACAVTHLGQTLRDHLKANPQRLAAVGGDVEPLYGATCDVLEQEDRRVIHELKLALCDSIKVFEELEQDTLRRSEDRLVNILRRIPTLLERFYSRVYINLPDL